MVKAWLKSKSDSSFLVKPKVNNYGTVELKKNVEDEKPPKGWGTRHTFTLMAFFGLLINQAVRVNISVAIVAMVKQGNDSAAEIGTECPFPEQEKLSTTSPNKTAPSSRTFDWSSQDQGIVMGAFFYGFILSMLPGGLLAERYGGKWVMFTAMMGGSICSLLSPLAAELGGTVAFIAVKIIQGLFQGPVIPVAFTLISKWIPAKERTSIVTIIWGGTPAGTVITYMLSGYLAEVYGWQWDFYVFGIAGLTFCVAWILLCYNSPASHPRISAEELAYIESHVVRSNMPNKLPLPPAKEILTSGPFWALTITFVGSSWGFYTMLTEIPTYLNNIQHISLTTNGFLSALPYLLMWLFSLPVGWIADWLMHKSGIMSRGKVRKMMTSIGLLGPAIGLTVLSFVECDATTAVILLCLSVMVNGTATSGFNVNQLELSPNYAGTLRGITSTLGNICGFAAPSLIGSITDGRQTLEAWRIVFLIAAGLYLFSCLVFVIFGRTSVQPWNSHWDEDKEDQKK